MVNLNTWGNCWISYRACNRNSLEFLKMAVSQPQKSCLWWAINQYCTLLWQRKKSSSLTYNLTVPYTVALTLQCTAMAPYLYFVEKGQNAVYIWNLKEAGFLKLKTAARAMDWECKCKVRNANDTIAADHQPPPLLHLALKKTCRAKSYVEWEKMRSCARTSKK